MGGTASRPAGNTNSRRWTGRWSSLVKRGSRSCCAWTRRRRPTGCCDAIRTAGSCPSQSPTARDPIACASIIPACAPTSRRMSAPRPHAPQAIRRGTASSLAVTCRTASACASIRSDAFVSGRKRRSAPTRGRQRSRRPIEPHSSRSRDGTICRCSSRRRLRPRGSLLEQLGWRPVGHQESSRRAARAGRLADDDGRRLITARWYRPIPAACRP